MSQFYDQASLVMIPSGYKNGKVYSQKPLSTDGELTFSRASNATRVNSSGLVEKVRTNLALYSEQFDNAAWTKTFVTVSANSIANPVNGTTTADTIIENSTTGSHYLYQSPSLTGEFTYSVYAKAKERDHIVIAGSINASTFYSALFDLTNGLVEQEEKGSSNTLSASIVSISSGWYRCSVTVTSSTAIPFVIWTSDGSALSPTYYQPSYAGDGTSGVYVFGAQAETGVLTDYIATTSSAVSVGPVSGLPRLDYSGGASCPSLLLEPQRTNLATYSEQMDNAAWIKGDVIVTANQATSPDGYTNADKIESNTTAIPHYFGPALMSFVSGTAYTASVFVKKDTGRYFQMLYGSGGFLSTHYANFDLQEGVITFEGVGATAKISDYSNGWYRCSITATCASNFSDSAYGCIITTPTAARVETHTTALSYWLYGYQVEAGAYASSYIGPTYSTAVTRVAESCSKTSATALIGQTEGTLYSEFVVNGFADFGTPLCINNGSTSESVWLTTFGNGDIRAEVYSIAGGGIQATFTKNGNVTGQVYKIAIGYASNNFAFYVNGTQVGSTDLSGSVPVGMDRIDFDYANPASFAKSALEIKQALVFKSRLSNADLATLTTI